MKAPRPSPGPVSRGDVRGLVLHVWRAHAAVRLAESALAGGSAALLTLWAAVASGGAAARGESWSAALLSLLLAAGAYWSAHRASPRELARRLDLGLGLEGALATAYECEDEGRTTRLAALLARRVLRAAPRRRALGVALPRSAPLLALPFLAGALLAHAQESARERAAAGPLGAMTGRVRSELADVGGLALEEAAALDSAELEELRALARRAAGIDAERREGVELEASAERLSALQADLEALATGLPADGALRRRLEEIGSTVDSALAAAGGARRPPASRAAAEPEGAGGADAAAADGAATQGALAPGAADGTMSRLESPAAAPGAPEAGLAGGRWWPAEDAALVERWIELRRAALRPER